MSFAMGALSRSKDVGLKEKSEGEEREREENGKHGGESLNRQMSEASLCGSTEDDEEEEEGEEAGKVGKGIDLGPQVSLKDQIEKDKDDESLRRWKEQLLGSVDLSSVGVDGTKEMLGTFSPQLEPYTCETSEETTPSGYFARGSYSARTKFIDDDRKCYLEINYTFDIRREWPSTTS